MDFTCFQNPCPVKGECNVKDTIYECIVTNNKEEKFKYIGKCSTQFIKRYRNHTKAIKNKKYSKNSELSKKIWQLKDEGVEYSMEWNLRKSVKSYQPGNQYCRLCLEEVHQIIFYCEPETLLNERNELYKKCRHKKKFKLNAKLN